MCFFYAMTADAATVAKRYGKRLDVIEAARQILAERERSERNAQIADPAYKTNIYSFRLAEGMYNIPAYAEPHCIIVSGSDQLQAMQWGLIPAYADMEEHELYDKEDRYKNARAENLFSSRLWGRYWKHKRCIIPSTGFFEPHRLDNGKTQYYHIRLKSREIFSMAGLWDEWVNPDTGEKVLTFVMITTEANPLLRKIHNGGNSPFRMPKILTESEEKAWLDPGITAREEVAKLLTVFPETDMTAWPVRQKFNYGDPYDESIIDEVAEQQKLDL